MSEDGRQKAPRETAAGLERDGKPPRVAGGSKSKVDPATQANMTDDSSTPDEFDIRAKSQTGKHVVADKWNR